MNMKYIFFAPFYQQHSNGIGCFWEAALHFSKLREVVIYQFYHGTDYQGIPNKYNNIQIIENINDINISNQDIVVYPDCVPDNPLNHHNIARYQMCKPFLLNGLGNKTNQYDFCFSYSNAVSDDIPQYLVFREEIQHLQSQPNTIRSNKALIYYGKTRIGQDYKNLNSLLDNFDDVNIITRSHPVSKKNLYQHISESRLLISFDPLSFVMHEATLLGTPVYVHDKAFKKDYDNFNIKLHGFYYDVTTKDLNKIYTDSQDLSNLAKGEIVKHNEKINQITHELILLMEEHFQQKKSNYNIYEKQLYNDISFFKNNWGYSNIFNISSQKNILRYHIINKYKLIGIMIFIPYRIIRNLRNIMKNIFNRIISSFKELFTPEEKSIIKDYLGKYKNYDLKLKESYKIYTLRRVVSKTKIKRNIDTKNIDIDKNIDINHDKIFKPTKFIKFFWR